MQQHATQFDLDAGVDCLAFANTLDGRNDVHPQDRLARYEHLVEFAYQTGQLSISDANDLRLMAERRPDDAADVLQQAIVLREAIYRIFSAIAAQTTPRPDDLDLLNAELHEAMAATRLVPTRNGFDWTWPGQPQSLKRAYWPVARSAAEMLISGELDRVRECAAHDCGWLFFDESRNRSRRWCSMQTCGNRAKVDRFRTRQRIETLPADRAHDSL
jgi:predicted RNA-binding Zn ribbon-like protein